MMFPLSWLFRRRFSRDWHQLEIFADQMQMHMAQLFSFYIN